MAYPPQRTNTLHILERVIPIVQKAAPKFGEADFE
jgi:hypothetical protein